MQSHQTPPTDRLLFEGEAFSLWGNKVVQRNDVMAEVVADGHVHSRIGEEHYHWRPADDREGEVRYSSDFPVLNAAYKMALDELRLAYNEQGLLSTGAAWSTVWTRDTSYAIHSALGLLDPEASMKTLGQRIASNGEIEQDTGTGGAWPVSSDRVTWGVAAWEIYLMTGDLDWLESACRILEETCLHDQEVIMDMSGLMRGETSFLDWRQQSYPDWMTTSDIGESSALSTMVLHRHVREILARMYEVLDKPERAEYWRNQSELLDGTIQQLFWMPYHGLYGQFVYGRGYPVLSERSDTLGETLAILFGVADGERAQGVMSMIPRCPMGVPCFYPLKSAVATPYHNDATWPFVEGYYAQAASSVNNEKAVLASLASLVRGALVCGTNKENLHIETGLPDGLAQSSDRQLWSIAGMLGAFYKGLFGFKPGVRGMEFRPCLPEELAGGHQLTGIAYRGMTFDIKLTGFGSRIAKCTINGEDALPFLPCDRTGHLTVEIELAPTGLHPGKVNWQPVRHDLPMPAWDCSGNELSWQRVIEADYYRVFRNGIPIAQTEGTFFRPMFHSNLSHYQIMAVSLDGRESFLNEPREDVPSDSRIETRPCGLSGDDVWVSRIEESDRASFYDITISRPGVYRVDAYYSNATGSLRDGNTCALRSLLLNGERVGSIAFPHAGEQGEWDVFNYTPGLDVALLTGTYKVELAYQIHDENTNHFVNDALIKNMRFTRISD